jgi:hypothetical protein
MNFILGICSSKEKQWSWKKWECKEMKKKKNKKFLLVNMEEKLNLSLETYEEKKIQQILENGEEVYAVFEFYFLNFQSTN